MQLSAGDSIAEAIELPFSSISESYQTAHLSANLANPAEVQLAKLELRRGEVVTAEVDTAAYGGELDSFLRIFQETGSGTVRQIASNDNFRGLDAGLTFQAATSGIYYVGVSSFDNTTYDPLVASRGTGSSHGLFDLNLSKTVSTPGLVGSSFKLSQTTAVPSDVITVSYTIENRGGAGTDLAGVSVTLLMAQDNRFTNGVQKITEESVNLADPVPFSGSFRIAMGELDLSNDSGQLFLGLQIAGTMPANPEQGSDWAPLRVLKAEVDATNEILTPMGVAKQIAPNSQTTGPIGTINVFQIALTQPGTLSAEVAAGGPTSLTLFDSRGIPIVQSDGRSSANPAPFLAHGLTAGTYYLKVNLREGASTYALTTLLSYSDSTLLTTSIGASTAVLVTGDFNGDGLPDLITGNLINADFTPANDVTTLLGNGDGTFRIAGSFNCGIPPEALVSGDFNGDDRLDLALTSPGDNGVHLLLGNGDGTFQNFLSVAVDGGTALAAGLFSGTGHLDLAVANSESNTVTLLIGDGQGGFQDTAPIPVAGGPTALAVGDFTEDGVPDLAVADKTSNEVTILQNLRDGTFRTATSVLVGADPVTLVAGDFNSDGHEDVGVAELGSVDPGTAGVTVLMGDGTGTLKNPRTYDVGNQPLSIVSGDFNGDGRLDLATANRLSSDVTVLLGQPGNTFKTMQAVAVGTDPFSLVAGDFNRDGCVDIGTANLKSNDVSLLLGHGDGEFRQSRSTNATGQQPNEVISWDFNGDGRIDLATANFNSGTVSVLLGQGDGTFQNGGTCPAGENPKALVEGDFNGDGRPDLAVANYGSNDMTVLLGNGDGTFLNFGLIPVENNPTSLVAADFNDDGLIDLAVVNQMSNDVTVLLGDGQGGFHTSGSFAAGSAPQQIVAGDFDGDGHLDLAVANYYSQDITVLLGQGNGTFLGGESTSVGSNAVALVVGDFNGDTHLDLGVTTSNYSNGITVLLGTSNATFEYGGFYDPGTSIMAIVTGDFNGDHHLDIAASNNKYVQIGSPANNVLVLLGDGTGTFQNTETFFPAGIFPGSIAASDFNGDGRLDLVTGNLGNSSVTTLLGTGTGSFLAPTLAPNPLQSTPLVANLTGLGLDSLVLTQTGQILFRRGLADQPGVFAPPVVLNPDPQLAARDLALVQSASGQTLLAALDATTFAVSNDVAVPRVTLYQPHADGTFTIVGNLDLPAGFLPANIASGDLSGSGLGDLIITAAATDQVFVLLQTAPGVFGTPTSYAVGVNPSAIELVDVNGDKRNDIVVTDRYCGQVSVLVNQGQGAFAAEERYRAGTGLYGLAPVNGTDAVHSLEGTNGVVSGPFFGGTSQDLAVINSGTNSVTLLPGDARGGFFNPATTVYLHASPTAIVTGHFITGVYNPDIAVLTKDDSTVSIFRTDGRGGLFPVSQVNAGNQPTGLSVADVTQPGGGGPDGIPDLLVGNANGDLLILAGNGDGSFSEYRRADQHVALAVTDTPGSDQVNFYFSNQGSDRLAYASAVPGTATVAGPTMYQNRDSGILAPGPEAVVTVTNTKYLVVVNSGGNDLFIYTLAADGQPVADSKQTFFTGTDPVSVTVTSTVNDLNGDTIPDVVVANQGSNDVSIFLGQLNAGTWTLAYRPRQSSAGLGPTSAVVADVVGAAGRGAPDGAPDVLVSNGQSDNVTVLPNRGTGFFINQSPADALALHTGADPSQVLVGNFDGTPGLDLVTINTASSNVTLIANFLTTGSTTTTVSSGGLFPTAAAAIEVDGTSGLLVANSGNGVLELLLGSASGFQVAETLVQSGVPHLSDLALVTAGNQVHVYGTDAGQEVAVLLATFGPSPSTSDFLPPGPGFPGGLDIPRPVASNPVFPEPLQVQMAAGIITYNDALSNPTVPDKGTIQDMDAKIMLQIGLTTVAFDQEPEAAGGPGNLTPVADSATRSPDGILLRNVAFPDSRPDDNPPDDPDQSDEVECTWTYLSTADSSDKATTGTLALPASNAIPLFWPAPPGQCTCAGDHTPLGQVRLSTTTSPAGVLSNDMHQPEQVKQTGACQGLELSAVAASTTSITGMWHVIGHLLAPALAFLRPARLKLAGLLRILRK